MCATAIVETDSANPVVAIKSPIIIRQKRLTFTHVIVYLHSQTAPVCDLGMLN